MTNRLELNWKLEGFVDEQRYYCSETPIDLDNLPLPKAVLAGDVRTHIDSDCVMGKKYYLRMGAVKNNLEKMSDEKSILFGKEWTPQNLSNLAKFWLNSDNAIIDSSSRISQLTDLSGNNFHFTQSNNAQKPILVTQPDAKVIRYDGVDDCLQITSGSALNISKNTDGLWVFIVARKASLDSASIPRRLFVYERGTSASTRFGLFSDDGTGNSLNKFVAGCRRLDADPYQYQASPNTVTTNATILCGFINYATGILELSENGSVYSKSIGGTANTSDTSSTKVTLGGQNGLESFNGDIYEVISGNGNLNTTDRQKLEGWAAHKYGVINSLPSNHPYKTLIPTL